MSDPISLRLADAREAFVSSALNDQVTRPARHASRHTFALLRDEGALQKNSGPFFCLYQTPTKQRQTRFDFAASRVAPEAWS